MSKFLNKILKLFGLISIGFLLIFTINHIQFSKIRNLDRFYFNPKYDQSITELKLLECKQEISIIGSSRTSGFEKNMFKNKSVYNYATITNSLNDIYILINKLNLSESDTIILGLDQAIYNRNYIYRHYDKLKKNSLSIPYLLFDELKFDYGISLIGSKAIRNFSGFRKDGSYFNGKHFYIQDKLKDDYNFRDTFYRIDNGIRGFEYGSDLDLIQIKKLDEILSFCKKKKILVYGFSPPYAPSVLNKMESKKFNYSYQKLAISEIINLFKKYNFQYRDFTKYSKFGDKYYLDGFHQNRNVNFEILNDLKIPTNKNFDNRYNLTSEESKSLNSYFSESKP